MDTINFEQDRLPILDAERVHEYDAGGLLVVRGLTDHMCRQLIDKSQQFHIRRWTPGDYEDRFISVEAIRNRERAGTEYYGLVDTSRDEGDLAVLTWLSPRFHNNSDYTFAIRSYEGYEGRGLGRQLLTASIGDFKRLHPEQKSVWLSVQSSNERAKHLYESTGFVHTSSNSETGKEIMTKILDAKNPKIVVIGGGTGSFTVLSGLKDYTENITAVVNMSDDGGSSGDLRDEYGVLPPGDIRQCFVALSDNDFMRRMFQYRFEGGTFNNHSLGNLILSGAEQMEGDFEKGLQGLSQLFAIRGQVVPVTTDKSVLVARRTDGEIIEGEETIGHMNFGSERPEIWLKPEGTITDSARTAITEADIVVIAPGNLYGSLAPALVVGGMKEALQATRAKKVYVSNLVTKPDQTEGFTVSDFASEIERFIGAKVLDYVLFNTDEPPQSLLKKYVHEGELVLEFDLDDLDSQHYQAIGLPLVAKDPIEHNTSDRLRNRRTLIRHDQEQLAKEIIKLLAR